MSRHRAAPEPGSGDGPDSGTAAAPESETEPESEPETEPRPETDVATAPERPAPRPRPGPAPAAAPGRPIWQRGPVLLAAGVLLTVVAIVAAVVAIRRDDGPAAARSSTSAAASDVAGLASPDAAQAFVAGATADITAVTAYDYRSLDIALSSGLAVTTGTYQQAYRAAISGELGARARADRIVQTFQQTAAGIGSMAANGRSATVLIFGIQSVTRGDAAPVATPVTLTATIVKQGNRFLISMLRAGANAGLPPGTSQLTTAAETARRSTLASLTLRRSTLDADYAAALADTLDPRRSDLAATLAPLRSAVARGRYQLTGRVTAIAIESVVGNAVSVLVAATGLRTADGKTSVVIDARLRVTVVLTTGGWRVTASQPVTA